MILASPVQWNRVLPASRYGKKTTRAKGGK
jgi:hypothetical protein